MHGPGGCAGAFPCPCCGHCVFRGPPGSHDVCPVCRWEDNLVQLRFPLMPGAANAVSLCQGQRNFLRFGVCDRRYAGPGRRAEYGAALDRSWRPLDLERDNPETPRRGVAYADSYPESDTTVLYYWRANYWRRLSS